MTTAQPSQQLQLLKLQAVDIRLTQIAHRKKNVPESAAVVTAQKKADGLRDRVVAATITEQDLARDIKKLEADVAQVRDRKTRDQQKLDSGAVPAKTMTALQNDIEHLDRRVFELENQELELMEAHEAAQETLAALHKDHEGALAGVQEATAELTRATTTLDAEFQQATAEREQTNVDIPEALLALYDQIRERNGGVGAAALVGRRCEGCRIDLTQGDLEEIRNTPKDTVVRCVECSRILVRTEQSAL